MAIPTIDISTSRPRSEIVAEIRAACLKYGFFQIANHTVSQDLMRRIFEQSNAFFGLPTDEKLRLTKTSPLTGGYEPFKTYSLRPSGANTKDTNEGFGVAPPHRRETLWPSEESCPGFREALLEYYAAVQDLATQVCTFIAEGLDQDSHFFDPYLHEQMAWTRLIHYYPRTEEDERLGAVGAGEHTDWGALTLLLQDNVGGLEVFDRDLGGWIPVPPHPGALTVNLGDLMSRWTNDLYRSTLHRVVSPPANTHRFSVPFFSSGNMDYTVEVIGSCVEAGQQPKYPPITAGAYIQWRHEQSVREY